MRYVFNYRKSFREPKKIRQITERYYLPFAVELVPAINFFIFVGITFVIGLGIRQFYPHAFSSTWVIFLIGIPLALTMLVTKVNPEGKNIYLYMIDMFKYYFLIKLPKKKFCNGKEVSYLDDKKITFKKPVKVVRKGNGEINAGVKDDTQEFVYYENGRHVRRIQNQERIDFHEKQESSGKL
ncbi:conjugal transfer protein [Oceanobacillus kimchii]|uniref:conjugal transfer protein n=1 Tax=Oceanobacillus kimchii TaxID=746691 RepID=UPI000347A63B|nr:conjugal transfer protein [Oceanobacillus kimchii]